MAYSYDRTASALSSLPASKQVDKLWNRVHDLDFGLGEAVKDYDAVASYRGKPGAREAQDAINAIKEAQGVLRRLAGSGGAFDKLLEAETAFAKKFGDPEDYVDKIRKEVFPR